jgi:hypothetical protein
VGQQDAMQERVSVRRTRSAPSWASSRVEAGRRSESEREGVESKYTRTLSHIHARIVGIVSRAYRKRKGSVGACIEVGDRGVELQYCQREDTTVMPCVSTV